MKRILVAGATGYLGRFVVRELNARGHFVRALARSREKLDGLQDAIDETFIGEVTSPQSLEGACDSIDVVFSSIGITKQKDGLTFRDVDYQGNKNLLDLARRAGVSKFVYVSAVDGPSLRHLDIVRAHEDFGGELAGSGLDYAVLRPTGYFSDMGEFLEMARKGRVYLIGAGQHRSNPIHGADLARACADAIDGDRRQIEVGGPEVLSYREIAELAVEAAGGTARITSIPVWVMRAAARLARWFNRHQGELLAFFTTMMTRDVVAPATGIHTLADHFRSTADREVAAGRSHARKVHP